MPLLMREECYQGNRGEQHEKLIRRRRFVSECPLECDRFDGEVRLEYTSM